MAFSTEIEPNPTQKPPKKPFKETLKERAKELRLIDSGESSIIV